MSMKERILDFLKKENKSSSQFAEEIGVQPSGISHILSGRNNPSLDFVLKMLERYSYLSTDWLLFGKGSMYKEQHYPTLFDGNEAKAPETGRQAGRDIEKEEISGADAASEGSEGSEKYHNNKSDAVRIVWFYADSSFEEYYKRKV
jgi:transcriptional regulator with XRE-family HTH domain